MQGSLVFTTNHVPIHLRPIDGIVICTVTGISKLQISVDTTFAPNNF